MASFDLHAWYRALDPTDQWLVEWRAQRDMSIKEIAKRSGLPPVAVAERLIRLRERLVDEARFGLPGD
jgi:DNA-directed RNA polymerase specialized sigma24 family protein